MARVMSIISHLSPNLRAPDRHSRNPSLEQFHALSFTLLASTAALIECYIILPHRQFLFCSMSLVSSHSSATGGSRRPTTAAVEVITLKDYKKAAKTLQVAFKDDLYVHYLIEGIEDPNLREQVDLALYEGGVYSCIAQDGLCLGVRDVEAEKDDPDAPFLAVACFEKPSKKVSKQPKSLFSSLWSMYQEGYLKFVWLANKETRQRVLEEQSQMLSNFRSEALGNRYEEAWYLADIGAVPRGRGKGLARALVDYACHNYVDVYSTDPDDLDDEPLGSTPAKGVAASKLFTSKESELDSEINSYHFDFAVDSDNLTDYSGYSSAESDASSAHSSWYYNEEDDLLAQYDRKTKGRRMGAPLYLESSHPRNRRIYQKLGFTYVKTVDVAQVTDKHGKEKMLTMDLMVRGPLGTRWQVPEPAYDGQMAIA